MYILCRQRHRNMLYLSAKRAQSSWCTKLQLQKQRGLVPQSNRNMKNGSILSCSINSTIELPYFFSSHPKELHGFRNKALQKLAHAQFPLRLSTLENGVNTTQQLLQKAISIIVFYKDHSTPTSKNSNMQQSATKCHIFHQSFRNETQLSAGAVSDTATPPPCVIIGL